MKKLDTRELLAFFAIYIVWGSTYLAIREAVATIPPLLTAGVRHFVAALVLYAIVAMRGSRTRVTAAEWRNSLVAAVLFFLIGHGTLHWAERTVPSGIAALFFATEPVWIAILMPAGAVAGVTLRTIGGLLLGLVGVGLLVPLESFTAVSREFWGSTAILVSALSWAVGVRYAATATLPRDPFVRAATMLLWGAVLLLAASTLTGEVAHLDVRAISVRSLFGLGYLIVFGSVVAFAAYTWLLERRSATLVATHTFVNPVVAVLLGWLVAGEMLTPRVIGAMGFILAALFLIRSATERRARVSGQSRISALEPATALDRQSTPDGVFPPHRHRRPDRRLAAPGRAS